MAGQVLFHAKKKVFWISMATVCEFPYSDKFSALPSPSPSNRAVNEVSRSDGRSGRAFVRIAPYILDKETNKQTKLSLYLTFIHPWPLTVIHLNLPSPGVMAFMNKKMCTLVFIKLAPNAPCQWGSHPNSLTLKLVSSYSTMIIIGVPTPYLPAQQQLAKQSTDISQILVRSWNFI